MKKLSLISFLTAFTMTAHAQHETDKWYFGVMAGINFTSGNPAALAGGMINTNEGCSSICDTNGALLLYTDGISVWNKYHALMPNGTGLMGGISSTQSALVVPQPGSSSLYYIFTVDETGGANGFRYSVVDITLQAGLGDVTLKNVPVQNNVTEKLTAVKNPNGTDYRIAVHEWGTDAFYVYSLNGAGFQPVPVISHAGIVHSAAVIQNTYGQMKFNPCGDRLALAAGYLDTLEVFDFDFSTGVVSNPVTLPAFAHVYGVEFSANSRFLYATTYDPSATLVQFDLAAGLPPVILASREIISTTPDQYALQAANNGKIYVCRSFSSFLGVIDDPLSAGAACNYSDFGFDLDPNFMGITSALGLPGFVQSNFRMETVCSATGISLPPALPPPFVLYNLTGEGFTLLFTGENRFSILETVDASGRVVERVSLHGRESSIHFGTALAPGLYLVRLSGSSGIHTLKAVKGG